MRHRILTRTIHSAERLINDSMLHIDEVFSSRLIWLNSHAEVRGPVGTFPMPRPYFRSDAQGLLGEDCHFANLAELLTYAKIWPGQSYVVAFNAICSRPKEGLFVASLAPGKDNRRELQLLKMQGEFPEIFGRDQQVLYVETARP